uniref:uncharacterized protein LOC109963416 n=1 Tax=Monopterus albus TaxID=43700 RepID=UPI0009B497FD|nr:uncharacterized protein LOC109963416 [Monopterus albus]XP_020461577.1 uncharacterized protein LOC109963416 [Monopterus albus]XP_020461578.1 uncharacterized protein LOC109963416 [Monopterus albus]
MDWALVIVLQLMFQPSLSVLFTVQAERSTYESEFGGDVVMGCRFQPKLSNPALKVVWTRINTGQSLEVYRMGNGVEQSVSPDYLGRVKILTEEFQEGWAKLKISGLRINDSGIYKCLVDTTEGADYKSITLSVKAPYKAVTKRIEKVAEGDGVLLTCQSEGYPEPPVVWMDGHLQRLDPNTTAESTPNQLFKVTSQIHVSSLDKNNYTCNFTNELSATFHIPDEIPTPHVKNDSFIIVLSISVVMAVIIIAVLMYRRRKGFSTLSTGNLLVDGQGRPASPAYCMEENLGAFLKALYCNFSAEARNHWNTFCVEELPHRLENNEGQPVNLQAVLPEAGQTLFLEGPPGSGKTALSYILVSSWTEGPTHSFSNPLDLNALQLLLYVDCTFVKGDLFQEIMAQLSLREKITEDELRTVLIRSSEALLLLDGYKEGNHLFDESLRQFLSERCGCRVLVMACPDHCPTLKETVGTLTVLKLQTQTVKY